MMVDFVNVDGLGFVFSVLIARTLAGGKLGRRERCEEVRWSGKYTSFLMNCEV
jgi:hypothetical protein